ncbi:MAG: GGDEF domain-containing protein [Caldilineaceae bacterium]|nr:GGDEF domain-containing protein [Caldilineaceae bacterium]
MRVLEWAAILPTRLKIILTLLLVMLLGTIDFLTGVELSSSLFYLAPIAFAAWTISTRFGQITALLSAAVWFWAEVGSGKVYSNPILYAWNTGIRFGIFLIIAVLLSRLRQALVTEQKLARNDYLTQAHNRRYFFEIAEKEILRSSRYQHPLSLAYIDLDNFKQVNDRLGHAEGDAMLRRVVEGLRQNLRLSDSVGRLGGDEFVILLPETDAEAAKVTMARVAAQLCRVNQVETPIVTFSIGVVSCYEQLPDLTELVKLADAAMYEAKSAGKNQIVFVAVGGP